MQVWHYGYLTWMGVSDRVQRGGVGRLLFSAFHDVVLKQVRVYVCECVCVCGRERERERERDVQGKKSYW